MNSITYLLYISRHHSWSVCPPLLHLADETTAMRKKKRKEDFCFSVAVSVCALLCVSDKTRK